MSKADVVGGAKATFVSAQDATLQAFGEACYDGAVAEIPTGGDPTKIYSQEELDGAVASAVGPLNEQVVALQAKDAADIQAGADALAALQVTFDAMAAEKSVEDGVIADLQTAKDKLAAVLESLSAIGIKIS